MLKFQFIIIQYCIIYIIWWLAVLFIPRPEHSRSRPRPENSKAKVNAKAKKFGLKAKAKD